MMKNPIKGLIFLWIVALVSGCDNREMPSKGHAIDSKYSPDNSSRAIVWEPELGGLGATMSQANQIWLQNLKGKNQINLIFEANKLDGLNLTWISSNVLEICYSRAQIYHFRNFFVVAERHLTDIYRVEIVLKKVSNLDDC